MSDERFSVVVWFPDGTYRYVERGLDAKDAVELAKNITDIAPGTPKLMITDSDDFCCFLWEDGKVVFPPRGGQDV